MYVVADLTDELLNLRLATMALLLSQFCHPL